MGAAREASRAREAEWDLARRALTWRQWQGYAPAFHETTFVKPLRHYHQPGELRMSTATGRFEEHFKAWEGLEWTGPHALAWVRTEEGRWTVEGEVRGGEGSAGAAAGVRVNDERVGSGWGGRAGGCVRGGAAAGRRLR